MEQPQAYFDGRFVPAASLCVSPVDAGFVLGTTVAEQVRTFGGRPFRLEDHLARLAQSLRIVGVELEVGPGELVAVANRLAGANHRLLEPGDDLGLSIFVTPGPYAAYASPGQPCRPTLCVHTYPLPFGLWAEKYRQGQSLVVTGVRQVPAECWPAALKCRSRMHYYLADRQAAAQEPGARALLLDQQGRVTEASTANVVIYTAAEGLAWPREERILHGISLETVRELAAQLGIPTVERDLTVGQVASADEVLLTSTPHCLLPVTRLDGRAIGRGVPGEVFRRLLEAWSGRVGLDIAAQAGRFAARLTHRVL